MIGVAGEDPLGFAGLVSTSPYQFSIQIPTTTTPKRYKLTAMGVVTQGQAVASPQITIVVERSDPPVSLRVQPSILELNIGKEGYLTVWGTYNDGSEAFLSEAASTTFVSNSTAIATVNSYGIVTAVSPGDTTILVNGTTRVPVSVEQAMRIAPVKVALSAAQTQQFFPRLSIDASAPSVTWSMNPPGVGSVSGTGVYTAPPQIASPQTILLTATDASNDTATATIRLLPAQSPEPAKPRPSCEELKRNPPDVTMIDPIPDLVQGFGLITDPEVLATGGRSVRGVTADGVTVVLLRFKAHFAGERLQITSLNDAGQPGVLSSEDGALAEIRNDTPGSPLPYKSIRFAPGQVTITAVNSSEGAIAFVLYRAPGDFARNPSDYNKYSRALSFRIQSLDLPCFTFTWPVNHRQ